MTTIVDRNYISGVIFIDYKKAFDLIDHAILLDKLKTYGVENGELALFSSYLKGRNQFVNIGDSNSTTKVITHGVPHGNVLGPILFLFFINDLPRVIMNCVTDIYAEDTTLSA